MYTVSQPQHVTAAPSLASCSFMTPRTPQLQANMNNNNVDLFAIQQQQSTSNSTAYNNSIQFEAQFFAKFDQKNIANMAQFNNNNDSFAQNLADSSQHQQITESIDHSTSSTASARNRTSFSSAQISELERAFNHSHYPDAQCKRVLSQTLALPDQRITVWFQNRRAKWRRKEQRQRKRMLLAAKNTCMPQSAAITCQQPNTDMNNILCQERMASQNNSSRFIRPPAPCRFVDNM